MAAIEYNEKGGPLRPGNENLGLSPNALRVLEKRYFLKDSEGRVIETPAKLFHRVAHNLAQADRLYDPAVDLPTTEEKFYQLMAKLEFLPNSPTLMNAGTELQQLSACFGAGTPISTMEGPKPIEQIAVGDMVLTHRGRYRRVVATMQRQARVFRLKVHRLPPVIVTGDHPFLTLDGWVSANELVGRYAKIGIPPASSTTTHVEFAGELEGELVYARKTGQSTASQKRHVIFGTRSLQITPVKAMVQLDSEIGWLLGMYLAEGCVDSKRHNVRFTLGVHEEAYAEKITAILRDTFGLDSQVVHVIDAPTSWLTVRVYSKFFTQWILHEFNTGFSQKRLPSWVMAAPLEFRTALLRGLADGNGTRVNVNQTRVTLSNENLVRQLFELAVAMDQTPCLKPEFMPFGATVRPWSITFGGRPMHVRDGAYLVESIEPVDGMATVYNFEVEDDNTYVANQLVVHNCFVLPVQDSLVGIFDALKWQALIHQSGGGCVSGESHVYTTFCGVERFEALYHRVQALGTFEEIGPGYRLMDVSHLGIRTPAVDPTTGRFAPKQVTHLWRWDVPADRQCRVRCSDGTEVITSEWHPFFVLTEKGLVERRTDELKHGDLLPTPNRSVRQAWPFDRYGEREGFVLDERLAWLVGFFLGDGSLDWFENRALRLRFFDGRPDCLQFAQQVLAGYGINVKPSQYGRGLWRLTTTDRSFVPRFVRVAGVEPGPKEALTMPEWVAKSPLSVIAAFLGGLMDSDGYVSLGRRRAEFSTACSELAHRLVSMLSALGLNPSLHVKKPGPRGKKDKYHIQMADAKKTPELVALVRGWVHDPLRKVRLERLMVRLAYNSHRRIPIPFTVLERSLKAAGVETGRTAIHRGAVSIGGERFWLHRLKWGDGIGEDKLQRLVRALRPLVPAEDQGFLDQLEHFAGGWTVVESVQRVGEPKTFYDMTVADFNNYLAGGGHGKLTVVHNTGFGFSRLRPAGDMVKSTQGVASGPVSFMKIFDAATQTVKQGGKRRGANMGILRVDHPDIEEFITCKDNTRDITNFNISVAITDEFMEAVKKGEKYDLVNPRSGKVVKQLDARAVFDKIAHQAWKNGEPGLFFIDITNRTNPCVAGDTLVATDRGLVRVKDLFREQGTKPIGVATDDRTIGGKGCITYREARGVHKTGIKTIWKLRTASGLELRATYDHQVFTPKGWVPLGLLRRGELIVVQPAAAAPIGKVPAEALALAADGGRSTSALEDEVVAVEKWGKDVVYDVTEPVTHSFIANGIVVHNCPNIGEFEATNPCGEQPLLAFESCNLGSIVVDKHMRRTGNRWEMDWDHLERSVRSCVHFLDNIVDMNNYPIPQIEELTKATRKIGLGVMGFARVLFKLGVAYDSPEGVEWGRRIMKFINDKAMDESQRLAEKRGVYPAWKGSMHEKMGLRMRNSYVTTVAPTGTICMIADTSGGCEPEFSLIWYKNVMDGDHLPYMLDHFMDVAKEEGFWSKDLVDKILANHGSCRGLKEVPQKWQRAFATSHDITPEWHVRMQAAFQEGCSAAVSKTINLPHDATVDDVKKAYLLAYELDCKGITVYRDGSRPEQVLNVGMDTKATKAPEAKEGGVVEVKVPPVIKPRPRPDELWGRTQKVRTGYGTVYVTVNEDEYGLFEVFAQIGRGGGYTASFTEAVARLISLCLRSGIPVEEIISQLEGIRSPRVSWDHQEAVFSIPDALAKALRRHARGTVQKKLPTVEAFDEKPAKVRTDDEAERELRDDSEDVVRAGLNPECPECGNPVVFEEGCVRCVRCGYSEC